MAVKTLDHFCFLPTACWNHKIVTEWQNIKAKNVGQYTLSKRIKYLGYDECYRDPACAAVFRNALKASGLKWNDPLFIFLAVPAASGEETRCGIICSRRFDKRAVVRNRARRLLWEAFRLSKERFPPCRIVMIPRRRICLEKMETVKTHLEALLPWLAKVLGNACADADS